jgi:hypothetical protein
MWENGGCFGVVKSDEQKIGFQTRKRMCRCGAGWGMVAGQIRMCAPAIRGHITRHALPSFLSFSVQKNK